MDRDVLIKINGEFVYVPETKARQIRMQRLLEKERYKCKPDSSKKMHIRINTNGNRVAWLEEKHKQMPLYNAWVCKNKRLKSKGLEKLTYEEFEQNYKKEK